MAVYSCYHINPIAAARCLWQTHTFLLSKMTVLAQSSIIKNSPCENFNKTETSIPPLPCKSHWLMNLSFKFKMKENESRTGMEVDLRMWPDLPPQHRNKIIGLNWVNWFWSVVGFFNICFETSEDRVFTACQGNLNEIQATKWVIELYSYLDRPEEIEESSRAKLIKTAELMLFGNIQGLSPGGQVHGGIWEISAKAREKGHRGAQASTDQHQICADDSTN